ncbi:putative RNA 3'-terminal phosphate cyclase-like protein [Triticum urartu]|uniref:Putative RNA 3'-terminal phosphate cyclase-like protein n=1 Tax=Triticum urartu TaxID=4572 RepID=M8A2I0_TRIUA|nr:putative RNA 3'-terminal phosphate cyclase-like protein [Triticum urartu]
MGRDKSRRLSGSRDFRQRLVLATLTSTPITIKDIRAGEGGLRPHEMSLLHLIHKVSDQHVIDVNDTGKGPPTYDRFRGFDLGWWLILVGSRRDQGITNDTKDPSVDTFRMVTLHMLKHFGVPLEGLELKIESRGAPPRGGGEVLLRVPNINSTLKAVNWIDEGMVKRIRGVAFSTNVSAQIVTRIFYAARGLFNKFIPDVHIFTDHRASSSGGCGLSAGYGVSVVAETTTGCLISADATVSYPNVDEISEQSEKPELMSPEDLGEQVASMLLEEVAQGGVVDSTHQVCHMMTLRAIESLRNIKEFLDVKFIIKPDPNSNTVTRKCVGAGVKNLARKIS